MDIINGDEQAYPGQRDKSDNFNDYHKGLTKREYFAAMALQGLLAANTHGGMLPTQLTSVAVLTADSLIIELNKS